MRPQPRAPPSHLRLALPQQHLELVRGAEQRFRLADDPRGGPHRSLHLGAHHPRPLLLVVEPARLRARLPPRTPPRARLLSDRRRFRDASFRRAKDGLQLFALVPKRADGGAHGAIRKHNRLEEGVAGQSVGTVHPGTRRLSARVQTPDGRAPVEVSPHAAAQVVRGGHDGDAIRRHVHPSGFEFRGDARKVRPDILRGQVADVQIHARRLAASLHRRLDLAVDGSRDNVARRELHAFVVATHESFAVAVVQSPAVSPHSLGDEERVLAGRFFARAAGAGVQAGGVELEELHVGDVGASAHRHGDAVAGAHARIGRAREELPGAARGEEHRAGEETELGAVTSTHDLRAHASKRGRIRFVRLDGEEVDGGVVFVKRDVGMRASALQERAFDLFARHVRGVDDAVLAVPTLPGEVKLAGLVAGELGAEADELIDGVSALAAHDFHGGVVAEEIASHLGVPDVLLHGVVEGDDGGDAALGVVGGALVGDVLGDDGHLARLSGFEGVAQAGDAAADDEEVDAHGGVRGGEVA